VPWLSLCLTMVWQPFLLLCLAHAIWAQPVTQQLVEDKDVNAINMTEREQKQLQCWIHNASILGKRVFCRSQLLQEKSIADCQ